MSATEELRHMLDERGVGYDVRDGEVIKNTYWEDADGRRWGYVSDCLGVDDDLELFLVHGRMDFTPEQAIAATLGAGTCHEAAFCTCSECGASIDGIYGHYCPNCGRQIVEEENDG